MDVAGLANKVTYKVSLYGGQRRMKEAILYVCQKAQSHTHFGLVKLNKILWRADFRSYAERRVPVTGRQYQRQPQGPVAVDLPPLLNELLGEGALEWGETDVPNERRPLALASPVMRYFSPDDIAYLDESLAHYRTRTAGHASHESHGVAWETRRDGDPMPYEAAFLNDEPLSEERLGRLAEIGRQRGWRSE